MVIFMKHGKKPTIEQSKIISNYHTPDKQLLNTKDWLVIKNLPYKLVIQNRTSFEVKTIPINRKRVRRVTDGQCRVERSFNNTSTCNA